MKGLFSQRERAALGQRMAKKKKKMKQFTKGLPSPSFETEVCSFWEPSLSQGSAAATTARCRPQVVSHAAKGAIAWTQREQTLEKAPGGTWGLADAGWGNNPVTH